MTRVRLVAPPRRAGPDRLGGNFSFVPCAAGRRPGRALATVTVLCRSPALRPSPAHAATPAYNAGTTLGPARGTELFSESQELRRSSASPVEKGAKTKESSLLRRRPPENGVSWARPGRAGNTIHPTPPSPPLLSSSPRAINGQPLTFVPGTFYAPVRDPAPGPRSSGPTRPPTPP